MRLYIRSGEGVPLPPCGIEAQTPVALAFLLLFACDSLVKTRATDPASYRLRGDRCEGVYIQDVSGSSNLVLASLIEHFESFDDTSGLPLRVEWTPLKGSPILLRASSLKSGLYYRMETARPLVGGPYLWSTSVLQSLAIGRDDIGVVCVTTLRLGEGAQSSDVYIPLRISQRRPPATSARYEATLWPGVELSEVFVTLATTRADGQPLRYVERDAPLEYGFYPAERGVRIRLPPLTAPGIYYVRIGATLKAGGSAATTFLLYHAGGER
ncbi:MAG TPA: hypothetical protein VKC15_01250 [Gemmatimonadales bacterium]|nr:hypothetical protein [Gemmatimonadales bacterium]